MKLLLVLAMVLFAAIAADTTVDLSEDIKKVEDDAATDGDDAAVDAATDADSADADAADAGAGDVDEKANSDDSPADLETNEDGVQVIKAAVGDIINLQMDEPFDGKHLTWEIIELTLGFNKIWSISEENFEMNEAGDAGVRTFKIKVDKAGEETVTLVRGDMSKFDDAQEDYTDESNDEHLFNLDLMKGAEYTQIKIKAE